MNLAESMKYVLKTKSQNIFASLVKEDFKNIFKEVTGELLRLTQVSHKALGNFSIKESFTEVKYSLQDTALLIKVIPQRVNNGFKLFQQELMLELEKLPDPVQRTKFFMKVLAGLSKFALSSAYDVRMIGMGKGKNIYSRLLLSKLIFKTIQSFVVRLIEEVEKEVTNPDELKFLRGFKETVLDDSGNAIDKFFEGVTDPNDRAFTIVENFKRYILTGA